MEFLSIQNILILLAAYIMGSIPTSLWAGKLFHKKDIRKYGSKNAGATNTVRVLGLKTGIPVLLFDIFKGWSATKLALLFGSISSGSEALTQIKLLLGLLAVMGHLFPVFAGFKGGKGIATLLGMFLGIHYLSALSALAIFALVFGISRIVSLASIIGVIAYPVLCWFLFEQRETLFIAVTLFFVLIVLYTHRQNIKRLLKGREKKLSFSGNEGEKG